MKTFRKMAGTVKTKLNIPFLITGSVFAIVFVSYIYINLSRYSTLSQTPLKIGSEAPGFSLSTTDGESFHSEKMYGQKTILFFFSPVCYRCIDSVPYWYGLYKRYKSSIPVEFIGICECISQDLSEFWAATNIEFPVLQDDKDIKSMYRAFYEPTVFLIDEHGKIVFASYDYSNDEGLKVVEKLLSK